MRRWLVRHFDAVTTIPDKEVGWLHRATRAGIGAGRQSHPNVVFSSAPPWTGHLAALRIARTLGVPLVADFRDPWARAPWRSARQTSLQRWMASRLERRVVTGATRLVFATHAAREEFTRTYGAEVGARSRTVANGCDASMFEGLSPRPARHDEFVFLHAGSLYGGRNPQPLLTALARAMESGRLERGTVRLRFLGAVSLGSTDPELELARLDLADSVEFVGRVPQRESLVEMLSASALLLLQPGTTMSVPAKAYEYLAAGRPILALTPEGETAQLVRSSGCGVVASPEDGQSIEDALVELVQHTGRYERPCRSTLFDGDVRAGEMAHIVSEAASLATRQAPSRVTGDVADEERV